MNTAKNIPRHKVYLAGIADRNGEWLWQGTVVAENTKQAFRFLSWFKKENEFKGGVKIDCPPGAPIYTERAKGVSHSMNIRQ
jgi:hypothetical protein